MNKIVTIILNNTLIRTFIMIALLIIVFNVFSSTVFDYLPLPDSYDDLTELFLLLTLPLVYFKLKNDSKVKKLLHENESYYKSLYHQNPDLVLSFDVGGDFLSADKTVENSGYKEEELLHNLVEETLVGIYIIQDEKIVFVNRKLVEMMGYTEEEIIGSNALDFAYPEDRVLLGPNLKKRILDRSSGIHYQYRAIKKDKTVIYVEVVGSKTIFCGKPAIIATVLDISEKKKAEETIEYMAYHDALTGLYNRYHFYHQLESTLSKETTNRLAVLFFDLDHFKKINDSMSHRIGDLLLKEVSRRLKDKVFHKFDLARFGGDEFIATLPNMDRQEVSIIAQSLLNCFEEPFLIEKYELYLTPSIGISLYPRDGTDKETLINRADSAMYIAKQRGKNNFQFWDSNQTKHSYERLEMETKLRKALEREELELYYQPKMDLTTGKITGAEALIRWNHPEKGFISPRYFIPLLEETGLITPIGEWVLRTACIQNKIWQKAGLPPMVISVNLSVRQLYQTDFVDMVRRVLEEAELEPEFLELEITETLLMEAEGSLNVLKEIKSLGVKISLDEFGKGYSSLHYLRQFPIDKLKIGQSFVRNCTADLNEAIIVKTIISMAHQLHLEVVAEGVELKEQLVFLQQNLCNEAQGYLFSKPLSAEEFVKKFDNIEQIIGEIGIPQELSNQMWLEEALQIARQELVDTIKFQQGMTFKFVEEDGKFIHTLCDGELLYRMGLVPELIIGRELAEFLPSDAAEKKIQYYLRAWAGEDNVTYEGEMNGIHYIASLRPITRGGRVVEVIGSCIDITDRIKAEKALLKSENKYRLIAENMTDLIILFHIDGYGIYASPSHQSVLGYPPEYFEGKSTLNLIHPDDSSFVMSRFAEIIETKSPDKVELRLLHANGEWKLFECAGTPVMGKDGQVEHIMVVAKDITEKRRAEELLRKSEKLSLVGELAAGVAHEIRNPITSIKGFIQLFQQGFIKDEYFNVILSEFNRIEDIINEFLTLAKPQEIKLKQVYVPNLVKEIESLIKSEAHLKDVEFSIEIQPGIPLIMCDGNQIKQVLINLCKNSMEAIDTKRNGLIKIIVSFDKDHIIIKVIDNGVGISQERLKRLGEPFYSNKEKGTGLGLMLCFRIIREHKGTITFESKENQGTTAEIRLPLAL